MRHPRTLLAASLLLGSSLSAITPAHAGWLKPWWPKIHLPEIDLPCIPHVACPGRYPARKFTPAGKGMASTIPTDVPDSVPHSLIDALGIAYETNPTLTGERAKLRATDENVPTALAGWRPQISVTASSGAQDGHLFTPNVRQEKFGPAPKFTPYYVVDAPNTPYNAHEDSTGVTVTQYLYRSGKTTASTHQAVNSVYAERATLIAQEVQVFSDVVSAYVGVVADRQLLQLDRANEQVLGDELRAIEDRYKVGELTRTDVAQAEAALAAAIATRETAEGTLQTANANFEQYVGVAPPDDLGDPQPLTPSVDSQTEAEALALRDNPNVIAAKFTEAQQRDAVDVAFSSLGPTISLQGSASRGSLSSAGAAGDISEVYSGTINLTMPIYQGGAEYAAVRQARQTYLESVRTTEGAARSARSQAAQAWDTLIAAQASIASSKVAVTSNEIALEGVEREALVGSATTQDVLIQQQSLLAAQITLVQNTTSVVTSSYGLAAAIGKLTARDMGLPVPLYDETAYYNAVRDRLWGTGDRAINEPGR